MPNKKNRACPPCLPADKPTRRGSALLLSTILLFVVLALVTSLSYVTVMEQKMSSKTKSSVGSFFNADSGVEWALNKIANATGSKITDAFAGFSGNKYPCPGGFGCDLYFLDENGKVIADNIGGNRELAEIKAVRSVGTQDTGDPTQRAIEAAVAAGEICSGSPTEISEITDDTKNFAEAAKYCHVTKGGCWHLPSFEEAGIFVNPSNEDKWIWTSTINTDPYIFAIRMPSGLSRRDMFSDGLTNYVACVK